MTSRLVKKRLSRQQCYRAEEIRKIPSQRVPEHKRRSKVYELVPILVLTAAASLFVYLCASHLALTLDEGIYLYGAERLLAGQHLYRDFFLFTGPGTIWLMAGLFHLVGSSFSWNLRGRRFHHRRPVAYSSGREMHTSCLLGIRDQVVLPTAILCLGAPFHLYLYMASPAEKSQYHALLGGEAMRL